MFYDYFYWSDIRLTPFVQSRIFLSLSRKIGFDSPSSYISPNNSNLAREISDQPMTVLVG